MTRRPQVQMLPRSKSPGNGAFLSSRPDRHEDRSWYGPLEFASA